VIGGSSVAASVPVIIKSLSPATSLAFTAPPVDMGIYKISSPRITLNGLTPLARVTAIISDSAEAVEAFQHAICAKSPSHTLEIPPCALAPIVLSSRPLTVLLVALVALLPPSMYMRLSVADSNTAKA